LRNPSYAGRAVSNRTQVAPARGRKSAMLPAGPGVSHAPRPEEDWITVPVPAIVSEEAFAQVQAKLDANQQTASRNTRHEYLLRALISCGACRLTCGVRQMQAGYRYYQCRGRTDPLRVAQGQRCTARYIPAGQLDELVWADLCALVTDPAQVARALDRAQGGAWLPQELHARQTAIRQALGQLDRQQQRLLDAYLAEIIALAEFQRKRDELDRRHAALAAQQRQLDAAAAQQLEVQAVADGIEAFCQAIRTGLATATFEQRRLLAELLIDRVIVTDGQVEIRYVLPTSPDGPHRPFCQLCKDHLDGPVLADQPGQVLRGGVRAGQAGDRVGGLARDLASGGVLPPAGDLDGLAGMREVQAADVGGLHGAGLGAAVPGVAGDAAGRHLRPGQRFDPAIQHRLVLLHHRDVVRLLLGCQPVQVRPHGMQGVEGHHGPGQVQRSQQLGEVAGLVVLDADLQVIQQVAAVLGDAEEMDPGAVGAAGAAGGLAVHGHGP
jgi:site-specific DNA recombinase